MTIPSHNSVFSECDGANRLINITRTKFTAREDDGTGLYYYRARYYHPAVGRFVSEDPIELSGGINFYLYVADNPITSTDPLGLQCDCPSGRWTGWGWNIGGMLVSGGAFTGVYNVKCVDSNIRCKIMVTCLGVGVGLGGGVARERIWVWNAYDAGRLSGESLGGTGFGGFGAYGVGGGGSASGLPVPFPQTEPERNPSRSATAGGGLGGGAGAIIFGDCMTSILRCN